MADSQTDNRTDTLTQEPAGAANSLPLHGEDQPSTPSSRPTALVQRPTESGEQPAARALWIRRADQGALALLVALAFLGTVAWWWTHGGPRGDLIEVERLESQRAEFLVDVNRAEWPELTQLPGIGETLARRIVESRLRDGPFGRCEDLRRVKGIGPKTIERLRPYFVFSRDETTPSER